MSAWLEQEREADGSDGRIPVEAVFDREDGGRLIYTLTVRPTVAGAAVLSYGVAI